MNPNTPPPRKFLTPYPETIRYQATLMENNETNQDRLCAKADAAQVIRLVRDNLKLSQTQFAKCLGVTTTALMDVESGAADYQHTVDLADRARSIFGIPGSVKG